jgi:hypothetical protein
MSMWGIEYNFLNVQLAIIVKIKDISMLRCYGLIGDFQQIQRY